MKPTSAGSSQSVLDAQLEIPPTVHSVVDFLVEQVCSEPLLSYDAAAREILTRFGSSFVVLSHAGQLAIRTDILHTFYERTKPFVVWSRSERAWRLRTSDDAARRQVD